MRGFLLPKVLFAFLALSLLVQAAEQTVLLSSQSDGTSQLITVQGDLSFPAILEGQIHERDVKVIFAVPADALTTLPDGPLNVHVSVKPQKNPSWLWFEEHPSLTPSGVATGPTSATPTLTATLTPTPTVSPTPTPAPVAYQTLTFTLTCLVHNGACDAGSTLTHSFKAKIQPPASATFPHTETIAVSASTDNAPPAVPLSTPTPRAGVAPAGPLATGGNAVTATGSNAPNGNVQTGTTVNLQAQPVLARNAPAALQWQNPTTAYGLATWIGTALFMLGLVLWAKQKHGLRRTSHGTYDDVFKDDSLLDD